MKGSIKYRFITIYFLLVLLVMSIVGTFIINRLESQQIDTVSENMTQTMDSIVRTSTYLSTNNWSYMGNDISNTLNSWKLSPDEAIYAIYGRENPTVIASTSNQQDLIEGKNALSCKGLNANLILKSLEGNMDSTIIVNNNAQREKHISMPVYSTDGDILGILYMTHNLNTITGVINDAKSILTYATIIALFITTVLGYFIANSITEPIRDLTNKASNMAKGDFNQRVDVKSDDEIGNLANMFNYLTIELKRTIKQMDLEKSKLDTIFRYMTEGVIAVNERGYLIHANRVAKEILGIENIELNNIFNLELLQISELDYKNEATLQGERLIEIKNNFYKIKYAPFKGDDYENHGIILVFQDITKEHKLDIIRKEFVANVSHELKTPITTIKTYTETILDSPDMDPLQINFFLKVIDRENNRMARLVSDLLQLSNMDYNNLKLNIEEVETFDIITRTLEGLHVMIEKKNHEINLDLPYDIKNISADRHALEQILMNIISNAVKYTENGGKISISANSDNGIVNIIVKDNGIGIPKDDLNRIFERFYRVEKGRSRAMGGTGLGLSIAAQMTKIMGGNIKIDSEFGKGTEVILSFKAVD